MPTYPYEKRVLLAPDLWELTLLVPAALLKRFAAKGLTASDVAASFPRDADCSPKTSIASS